MLNAIKKKLEEGRVEEATSDLNAIVDVEPGNLKAWTLLSAISMRTDNWELGAKSFSSWAKLNPSSSIAWSGLVRCLLELKQQDSALEKIREFKSLCDPNNSSHAIVIEEFSDIEHRLNAEMNPAPPHSP